MILLVTDKMGFLFKSLADHLKEREEDVQITSLNPMDLISADDADALVLFTDPDIGAKEKELYHLKDFIMEKGYDFFIIGQDDEITDVYKFVPEILVTRVFKRPFNTSEAVTAIIAGASTSKEEKRERILVVDDSGVMLRDIKGWLGEKYRVDFADSGLKAIQYLASNRPDLILLDYEMPIMDGRQVLELIRSNEEYTDIPVIFLTSKNDKESIENVISLKPDGYILKSAGADRIISEVDKFFAKLKANRLEGNFF
ncbi:MAG: response regulator [Pseudobutyrivibrio sp.]|nr:response regulator [Pseudobutyrivibrio sp.]